MFEQEGSQRHVDQLTVVQSFGDEASEEVEEGVGGDALLGGGG
jgi:hypothetical protein